MYKADKKKASACSCIPPGKYKVALMSAKKKEAQSGNGAYLACQFKVVKGKRKGAVIFDNLNLENVNEQAVEIAERILNQLMLAVGVTKIPSKWKVNKLMNKPCWAIVAVSKRKGYDDKNVINRFIFDTDTDDAEEDYDDDVPF